MGPEIMKSVLSGAILIGSVLVIIEKWRTN